MTTLSKPRAKPGAAQAKTPSDPMPSDPMKLAADPTMSKDEKLDALESLEQDAKQLAVAADEGMSGGEQTNLRTVLEAKRALDPPPVEIAFAVVAREFEEQLRQTLGTQAHAVISAAIEAVDAARRAIAERAKAPSPPPGVPAPGSAGELREELDKEKLDPGG